MECSGRWLGVTEEEGVTIVLFDFIGRPSTSRSLHCDIMAIERTPHGLLALPEELIAQIATYLPPTDLFATRLTHRTLLTASEFHFGHVHFRKRGFMLTEASLSVLQSISTGPNLRKHVQHVWFNPDCYTFVRPDCAPSAEEAPDPDDPDSLLKLLSNKDRQRYVAYRECMQGHVSLIAKTGAKLQTLLIEIFSNLPNLKIIGMRRSEDHAPYGWRTLMDAVGEDPRVLGPTPSGPKYFLSGSTRLFVALMNAVAASDIQLRRLYTDAVEIDNILTERLPDDVLTKACASIWYLELNATLAWVNKRKNADYKQLLVGDGYGDELARILHACTSLQELGLQLWETKRQHYSLQTSTQYSTDWWSQKYPAASFSKIATINPVNLAYLTRVKLEKVVAEPATFQAFLAPSQNTLISLKVRDVRLLSTPSCQRPWQPVFAFLRDECPQLDYLFLYHLLCNEGGVSFVDLASVPALEVEITGLDQSTGDDVSAFTKYEYISLELKGREEVREKLRTLEYEHFYQGPVFSYAIDEGVWHTDTSDEEW